MGILTSTFNVKSPYWYDVRSYGAIADGTTDCTTAFNSMWQDVVSALQTVDSNIKYVPVTIFIPPGTYNIASSINFTGLFAWNIHVLAHGAVLKGTGTNKHVIEMLGSRGIHLDGLTILGDATNTPMSGIFYGCDATNTNGNNKMSDVKVIGSFNKAAVWNIGCETSQHINCQFNNSKADTSTYAYLADGLNRFSAASDYATVRSANVAVSFTQNSFLGCHFRHYGQGVPIYLEFASGWVFDKGCYYLTFGRTNFQIRSGTTYRTFNLSIDGLYETAISPSIDYNIEILVPSGESTSLTNCQINLNSPHASVAFIKHSDTGAGTPGDCKFKNCDLRFNNQMYGTGTVPMFETTGVLNFTGNIYCASAANLNLSVLTECHGNIYVDDSTALPAHSHTELNIFDETNYKALVTSIGAGKVPQTGATGHFYKNDTSTNAVVVFENAGSGDAISIWSITGKSYEMGIDNSDSDKLKIGNGTGGSFANPFLIFDAVNYSVVTNVEAKTSAGALTTGKWFHTLSNSSGSSYAVTLAAPSYGGITKTISMIAGDATNSVTLALTNVVGGSAATTATFDAAGETLVLVSIQTGASTFKWLVIKEHGVTLT